MKRFRKVYLEISNICNLSCKFCPGTIRKPAVMQEDAFCVLLDRLKGWTDYLYFHLMGEPLCHPYLKKYLALAADDFKVILTTNGTLLPKNQNMLLNAKGLHKVNISLHSFEEDDEAAYEKYLGECFDFADKASRAGVLVVFRLWNKGHDGGRNQGILAALESRFPDDEWKWGSRGVRIRHRLHLEYGDRFEWPDSNAEDGGDDVFCYGLSDHFAILCDGRIVPCCLDRNGDITLGNVFEDELPDVLSSERARNILDGFKCRRAYEDLCRRCGYARMKF